MKASDFTFLANRQARTQQDIEKLVELAGWKNDSRIAGFIQLANLSGDWGPLSRLLSMRLKDVENAHPFTDLPPAELVAGDIMVGYVVNPDWTLGCPVFLTKDQLNKHGIIAGPPRKGKTWTAKSIAIQYHHFGARDLILDADRQFVDLPFFVPPGESVVFNLSKNELKRNIWQPLPGGTFEENESRLLPVFNEVWVGPGGGNILSELSLEMYAQGGLFTMSQIYERLKGLRGQMRDYRRRGYLEGVISPMSNLVNHLRQGYDVLEGYPLDELLKFTVVLDVRDLSPALATFVNIELLSAIAKYTLRDPPDHPILILWDEAQRLLKAAGHAETVEGEPVLFEFFRGAAKRTIGVWVMTHLASEIPREVSGNVACHIYFQTSDADSITRIGRALSLTPEQQRYIPELPDRVAVMKHPNFPKPFLVRIADMNLEATVSDEEVTEMMAPILASLKWKPSSHIDVVSDKSGTAIHKKAQETPADKKTESQKHETILLTKDESDYLIDIARTPFEPSTERDRRLKLSGYKGDDLRKSLAKRKMIEACKIRTGRRGGQVTLLETKGEGWEYLKSIKSGVEPPRGKGGFVHKYYQHAVKKFLDTEHGCESVIEDSSAGKAVDVTAEIDGEKVAIEILVTVVTKEESNILSDVDAFGKTLVLVQDEKQLSELGEWVESELDNESRSKVGISIITDFLNQK